MIYIILAITGLVLPYFLLFTVHRSIRFEPAVDHRWYLFNDIATFFAVDLVIATVVFLIFSFREYVRSGQIMQRSEPELEFGGIE